MANTYSQLYVHYIFAVQNRLCLIKNNWHEKLYIYSLINKDIGCM